MKKILFTLFSVFILSACQTNETDDLNNHQEDLTSKSQLSKNTTGTLMSSVDKNVLCGGGSFTNPINVNPNYPYITGYTVAFWDNSPLIQGPDVDKYTVDLSHFVIRNLFPWDEVISPSIFPIYYGYSNETAFSIFSEGHNWETKTFTIGQDGDNAAIYGDMFSGPGGFMTNDATNTVLHGFKSMLAANNLNIYNIKAIHIKTDGLLCIPSVNYIKITIKY